MKSSGWCIVGIKNCGTRDYLRIEDVKRKARDPGMNPMALHQLRGDNLAKKMEEEWTTC